MREWLLWTTITIKEKFGIDFPKNENFTMIEDIKATTSLDRIMMNDIKTNTPNTTN